MSFLSETFADLNLSKIILCAEYLITKKKTYLYCMVRTMLNSLPFEEIKTTRTVSKIESNHFDLVLQVQDKVAH